VICKLMGAVQNRWSWDISQQCRMRGRIDIDRMRERLYLYRDYLTGKGAVLETRRR